MWKELNSFSAAYLVNLCHPWTVFFNTLTLWQGMVLTRYGHCVCQSVLRFGLCFACGLSVGIWTMNAAFCIWHSHGRTCPRPGIQGYSIFVTTDLCWSSSLVYSGLHCACIVFSVKVLRKHRAFSGFNFVSILPHIFSFLMCWFLDFSVRSILPDNNLMLPSSPLQCPLPSKIIPCFRDQLWNSITMRFYWQCFSQVSDKGDLNVSRHVFSEDFLVFILLDVSNLWELKCFLWKGLENISSFT